jgi:uncharacterized membrane protein
VSVLSFNPPALPPAPQPAPSPAPRPAPQRALQRALRPAHLAGVTLALLIALYGALAGGVALRRHQHLQSQALDMGYAGQVTWNAMRGHGLRFTVFRGQVGDEGGQPLRFGPQGDRDSLFAYHVELLYYPISLLYRLYAGPQTLIVLLTAVLALGAIPAYAIARGHLDHRGAALAFAAMYLLTPSIQGANLADFHAVSLTPTILLLAILFLFTRRDVPFLICATVAAAAKEEVGLLVLMMGLYAWLVQGRPRFGLAVAVAAGVWVALCFLVIIPGASGSRTSLFIARYSSALRHLRDSPAHLLAGQPALPVPGYTVRYVLQLLAGTSFLALAGPLQLALGAPILALNGLSGSTWQHGGGAHYSAEVVPALIAGAVCGARWIARTAERYLGLPFRRGVLALALVGLAGTGLQAWRHGALPPGDRFSFAPEGVWGLSAAHAARLAPLLQRIPPEAPVSAQSNVHPHLATRERLYVFPTVDDAEYILADVAGTSDPLYPDDLFMEVTALLAGSRFELLEADDGLLLFRLRAPGGAGSASAPGSASAAPREGRPPDFLSFTRPAPGERQTPAAGALGWPGEVPLFDVLGYHLEPLPEVNFAIRRVRPTLYLQARRPVSQAFRFTPFVVEANGLARISDDGTPTQLWYPSSRWEPGAPVRLSYPPLSYGRGDRLGLGIQIGVEAVTPRLVVSDTSLPVADGGRVLVLGRLP